MANVAYVRVSSTEQNEARQIEALKPHHIDKWFQEKVSGKNTDRPQFKAMLDYIREGDTVFVEDLSRLSRSLTDLMTTVESLQTQNIKLVSLKESIDTSTAAGRLMIGMIGIINQFERENLLERQREGIACAKAKGVYKGRKRISYPPNWSDVYHQWERRQITATQAMAALDLKRNTYYNLVKQYQTQAAQATHK